MWEIDISVQTLGLLWSLILGVLAAWIYDILRAINKTFRPKTVIVFLFDIFYWIILSFCFFIFFMVFTNGQVRAFAFFGAAAGFLFSFLVFSKITLLLFSKFFSFLRLIFRKIKGFFCGFVKLFVKTTSFFKKTLKKAVLKIKKS